MRILIFGAAGFIGAHLVRYIASQGHEVVALCRSGAVEGFNGKCVKWAFGAPLSPATLAGVDCAIHLAHDFSGADGARLTLDETLANVARLRSVGVGRQIFFSSYSAGEHASSLYGQTKYELENRLAPGADVIIVRPGLVLGAGGIYGRIRHWAMRLPVIPLPDGGRGRVPVIELARLCRETLLVAEAAAPGREFNLFEKEPRSLRQLVLEAAAEAGRKPWIVPVPATMIALGLRIASALRLPLPVNADNLEGFMANQSANHLSTLRD